MIGEDIVNVAGQKVVQIDFRKRDQQLLNDIQTIEIYHHQLQQNITIRKYGGGGTGEQRHNFVLLNTNVWAYFNWYIENDQMIVIRRSASENHIINEVAEFTIVNVKTSDKTYTDITAVKV